MKALLPLIFCAVTFGQMLPQCVPTPIVLHSDSHHLTFIGTMSQDNYVALFPSISGTLWVEGKPFFVEPTFGMPFSMGIFWRWSLPSDMHLSLFLMPYQAIGGSVCEDDSWTRPVILYP